MIVRDFNNGFNVADWTEEMSVIPNSWGTIGSLGLFEEIPVAEHVVVFEEITKNGALIVDRVRGDRAGVSKDDTRKLHTFAVPHFPVDDYISPQDLQGKRAYGKANEAETLEGVRTRKMENLRMRHAWTQEAARAQLITACTVYAPSGTVSQNWLTEFSKSRTTVDFAFTTSTTDVVAKVETGIAAIQDNAGSSVQMTGTVVLCSPTWFAALIAHASTKTAYTYYTTTSAQQPLRERLGGKMAMHRTFEYAGTTFIEMRDAYNGTALITADKAYMIPTGSGIFKTFFSPANRFGFVNTLGEQVYYFENMAPNGTSIQIETESNFVNACYHPELLIEFTKS